MFIGYSVLQGIQRKEKKRGSVFDVPLKIISVSYALCLRFVRSSCAFGLLAYARSIYICIFIRTTWVQCLPTANCDSDLA